jgi:hypothetical protein
MRYLRTPAVVLVFVLMFAGPAAADPTGQRLAAETARTSVWVNVDDYTPPVYDVWAPATWGFLPVTQGGWQDANAGPVRATWKSVPLPDYFAPSPGADGEAILRYHGAPHIGTYEYCEFWGFNWTWWQGPTARWGGCANDSQLIHSGGARSWAKPLGTQASGLAFIPGLLMVEDLTAGRIDHELQIAVPEACGTVRAPATRTDASASVTPTSSTRCLEYGTLLKLPANQPTTGLSPLTRMVVEAAKTYGLRVSDQTNCCVVIRAENWKRKYAPWSWDNGGEPTNAYADLSWDDRLLRNFPWSSLSVAN